MKKIILTICLLMSLQVFAEGYSNVQDAYLVKAAVTGDLEGVIAAIKEGANVNVANPDHGATPLHYAAAMGNLEVATCLLKHGAKANIREASGSTPLYYNLIYNKTTTGEMINLLIKYGAKINIRNNKGYTPKAVAQEMNMNFPQFN